MRRLLLAAFFASALLGCHQVPAELQVEKSAVSTSGIDVTLHFATKDYKDVVPRGGSVEVLVKDLVPTANVFDDDKNTKEVCRATTPVGADAATPDKRVHLHLAATCPAMASNVTRKVSVTFTGADGSLLTNGAEVQHAARPDAAPKEDVRVTFKRALENIPEPRPLMADKACSNDRLFNVDRKDRDWLKHRLYSWDDAARELGVAGAGPLCPNLFDDVKQELTNPHQIAAVLRMDTCVLPTADAATKSFTRGSATGLLAIVDLNDGNVLCYGRMTGKTSSVVDVMVGSTDPQARVLGNFEGSVEEAAFARMRTLSKYLGLGEKDPDPR